MALSQAGRFTFENDKAEAAAAARSTADPEPDPEPEAEVPAPETGPDAPPEKAPAVPRRASGG